MNFLIYFGEQGFDWSAIDWQVISSVLLKVLLIFVLLLALFILFSGGLLLVLIRSVSAGLLKNSLRLAFVKFLNGFFYLLLLAGVGLFLIVALPFRGDFPLYAILLAGLGISLIVALLSVSFLRLLFSKVLMRIAVFRRLSAILHRLILLVDSYTKS